MPTPFGPQDAAFARTLRSRVFVWWSTLLSASFGFGRAVEKKGGRALKKKGVEAMIIMVVEKNYLYYE